MTAMFCAPLRGLFEDPDNKGWVEPTGTMKGNGFGELPHAQLPLPHPCQTLPKPTPQTPATVCYTPYSTLLFIKSSARTEHLPTRSLLVLTSAAPAHLVGWGQFSHTFAWIYKVWHRMVLKYGVRSTWY